MFENIDLDTFRFRKSDKQIFALVEPTSSFIKRSRHIEEKKTNIKENKSVYQSIWSLQGVNSSRRDDIMALGFVLLHLLSKMEGNYPLWFDKSDTLQDIDIHLQEKLDFLDKSPQRLPAPIRRVHSLLASIKALRFVEVPNYQDLKLAIEDISKPYPIEKEKVVAEISSPSPQRDSQPS